MVEERAADPAADPVKRRRRRVATRAEGAPEPVSAHNAAPEPTPDPAPAPAQKGAPARKTVPAQKAAPARKADPAQKADPARKASAARKAHAGRPPRDAGGDGGLRDIVGAGPSKLGVDGALRARDVNRPSDADLAAAERDVVIVRRNWKPQQ